VRTREDASAALLNYGFGFYETRRLYAAGAPVMALHVWKGSSEEVQLGVPQDVYATLPRGQEGLLKAAADIPEPVLAPLSRSAEVGKLRITLGDKVLGTYPLRPVEDVAQAGFFGRLVDDVKLRLQ
jgi:D-alanyl-D-alanine carboxypeptidase (penicillin-binding protein 5/6)